MQLREVILATRRLPQNDQIIIARAKLLTQKDMALVEAVLIRGQSAASVARLTGLPVRRIRAKVGRLSKRICSREFVEVARALPYLSASDAALARLRFCARVSQRRLSLWLRIKPHLLRRRLDRIRAQIATIGRLRRATRGDRENVWSSQWRQHDTHMDASEEDLLITEDQQ